jgi:hypothetical protein
MSQWRMPTAFSTWRTTWTLVLPLLLPQQWRGSNLQLNQSIQADAVVIRNHNLSGPDLSPVQALPVRWGSNSGTPCPPYIRRHQKLEKPLSLPAFWGGGGGGGSTPFHTGALVGCQTTPGITLHHTDNFRQHSESSFDPKTLTCAVWGAEGMVHNCFILSDQCFPPSLPSSMVGCGDYKQLFSLKMQTRTSLGEHSWTLSEPLTSPLARSFWPLPAILAGSERQLTRRTWSEPLGGFGMPTARLCGFSMGTP